MKRSDYAERITNDALSPSNSPRVPQLRSAPVQRDHIRYVSLGSNGSFLKLPRFVFPHTTFSGYSSSGGWFRGQYWSNHPQSRARAEFEKPLHFYCNSS